MKKATHNGTCQVCGNVQARSPRGLAKHGYTVTWGFFSGTCQGSGNVPIEEGHDLLDSIVVQLTANAARLNALTPEKVEGITVRWTGERDPRGKRTTIEMPFDCEAAWDDFRKSDESLRCYDRHQTFQALVERYIAACKRQAKQMISHCEALEGLKASRYGQPLIPRVDPKAAPDRCPGSGQPPAPRKDGNKVWSNYRRCASCGIGFTITQRGLIKGHKLPKAKSKA